MRPRADSERDLVTWVQARAQASPGREIFRFAGDADDGGTALTYGELDERARAIAAHLVALGARGRRALLLHAPGQDYLVALVGCLYGGVVAVPAYPPRWNRPFSALRGLATDSEATFALTTETLASRLTKKTAEEPFLAALRIVATDTVRREEASAYTPHAGERDDLALLQYTSGSTTAPKGVMLSQRHFLRNIEALVDRVGIVPGDTIVSWLPPYHDMGLLGGILLPVVADVPTTLMSPTAFLQRPLRWLQAVARTRATISGGPNFAYELAVRRSTEADRASLDLGAWRVAFTGAERVRQDTIERFAAAFAGSGFRKTAFSPCYGLAEATLAVTFGTGVGPRRIAHLDATAARIEHDDRAPAAAERAFVSCGAPLEDVSVVIVDPTSRERREEGDVGEIWVAGNSIAHGYLGKPGLTKATFHARIEGESSGRDYLRTGDLGFLDRGELFVTGRLKDLVVLRGVNRYPEDLEATATASHPALRAFGTAAFSVERNGEERLVIVHEVDRPRDVPLGVVAHAVESALAEEHDLPVEDVVLVAPGGVPKTTSGKIQRSLCRERYLDGTLTRLVPKTVTDETPAPLPALVARIATLMAELLGVEPLAPTDDFFWLGGHSLLATRLASRIREELSIEVSLRAIFDAKTPERLAAELARAPRLPPLPDVGVVDRNGHLPLSFSQERMWFLHQLDPKGAAYNVAGAVWIDGSFDTDALARSLDTVVARHETLRTRYVSDLGEPRVVIDEAARVQLVVTDASAERDPKARAADVANRLAAEPFDITRAPLFRASLVRTGPKRSLLAVCLHHLVTDAWSMGVLLDEVLAAHDAILRGESPSLPPLRIGYVDYAHWQRTVLEDRVADHLSYFRKALASAVPVLLPTDRPRPPRRSSAGAFQPLPISSELFVTVEELGKTQGATTFMILFAAFAVLLHRYTGQTDLVVGVPVANRNRLASEPFIGTLVNTLPIRISLDPQGTFAELVAEVRSATLSAYAHQDLPFERLVKELSLARRPGEAPLLTVMFDFQNPPMRGLAGPDLTLRPAMLTRGASQFDLSLLVLDTPLGRSAGVEYSTELFDGATVTRFLTQYLAILNAVTRDPRTRLARIGLLGEAERRAVLALREGPRRSTPFVDVPRRFERIAASRGAAPALSDESRALSYAATARRVSRLATALETVGVGPGSRVAVLMDRGVDLVVTLLAILETGAAYVPLDPRYPPSRLTYVLEDASPAAIVTTTTLALELPLGCAVLHVDELDLDAEEAAVHPIRDVDPASAAYVIYTSGSTGKPKGVEVSRGALTNFLESMSDEPGISGRDRWLAITTVAFDIATLELLLPVVSGARVHVARPEVASDGARFAWVMEQVRPTIVQGTPSAFRLLLDSGWSGDTELTVLCGGEAMPRALAQELLPRVARLFNMYGPTETTIWSSLHQVHASDAAIPIGRPIHNTSLVVLDTEGELTPFGVPGEIYIGGSGVARGYLGKPELTDERFVPDPLSSAPLARRYRTGDAGRLKSDGTFEHLGRLDHQIKIRGFRVEPGEIEAALVSVSGAREAVVIAYETQPSELRLVAYYVPGDETHTPSVLRELLARQLPAHFVPASFVALERLPRTPNGKLDRLALPPPERDSTATANEYVAPRDLLESSLADLWTELLGTIRPGVRDGFFELGGHSLLAVRMLARVTRDYGVELPLASLLEGATIAQLAELIRSEGGGPRSVGAGTRVKALRHGTSFLVPIQHGAVETSAPSLFCVHGAGGNVLHFSLIARHVGGDLPFYGFQARGTDGRKEPHERIEDMAAAYLDELRREQPHGPYYLAGYCGGGLVAFDMACRLTREGERVALVALIDSYCSTLEEPSAVARIARNIARRGASYVRERAVVAIEREAAELARAAQVRYHRLRGEPIPYELRDFWLTTTFFRAARAFRPLVYPGKLTVLRATEVDRTRPVYTDLGWSPYAAGGLEVRDIPGDHDSLAREPHVATLGKTLRACFDQALRAERRH